MPEPNAYHPIVESLEDRCLLAGPRALFSSATGILQIRGTDQADHITVVQRRVRAIRVEGMAIRVDGLRTKTVRSLVVKKVEVFARGGDDVIDLRALGPRALVRGGFGKDVIRGGALADDLDGGFGTDTVLGGRGDDKLQGGPEADVLLGGAGKDLLAGDPRGAGPAPDRFLRQEVDRLGQAGGEDAVLWFDDGLQRAWTETEILAVDEAFARVLARTNNTRLLKLASGGELHFLREAARTDPSSELRILASNNSRGRIRVYDLAFTTSQPVWETILHEIGHNWEEENPYWTQFQELSGWTQTESLGEGFRRGRDPDEFWWHRTAATFATSYARWNPREDFCESFAATLGGDGAARIPAKVELIDTWLNGLIG